jgi:hypothetical protein
MVGGTEHYKIVTFVKESGNLDMIPFADLQEVGRNAMPLSRGMWLLPNHDH